jgi:UDP-GlcNAc3NAcA epimerase
VFLCVYACSDDGDYALPYVIYLIIITPMKNIVTILGARPQFIKAAAVSRAMRQWSLQSGSAIRHRVLHTGQHYDDNMSAVFFRELALPESDWNLGISQLPHEAMVAKMRKAIAAILRDARPDCVMVYGDTNSTLAGALAAHDCDIAVAHVEAGLRSFNPRMTEEINRVKTDALSGLLLCPTAVAVHNLRQEGIMAGVHLVGDVMLDIALLMRDAARHESTILTRLQLEKDAFILASCHRAENINDPARLEAILRGLEQLASRFPVVFPMHPATRKSIQRHNLPPLWDNMHVTEPLSYLDMAQLTQSAALVVTDSGGLQKEAYFYRVPCVTLRDETEWVETLAGGWNRLCPVMEGRMAALAEEALSQPRGDYKPHFGDGTAADKIVRLLAA